MENKEDKIETIEMQKNEFMNILHSDDRNKYISDIEYKAQIAHENGDNKLVVELLKERNEVSGCNRPLRINEIKDGFGYLLCYEDVSTEDDGIIKHVRVKIQKVKLVD